MDVGAVIESRGSARLVWGEVTDVVGPVIPADPCDASAYAYVRPHYEITIREKSGESMTVIWLDKEARPADVAVGDQLLGGVRQVGAENFVQRFVIVNPTRGQAVVPASLPSLGSTARVIDPACQLVARTDVEFAAAMHARPDASCDYKEPLDSRGRGGTDDPTAD